MALEPLVIGAENVAAVRETLNKLGGSTNTTGMLLDANTPVTDIEKSFAVAAAKAALEALKTENTGIIQPKNRADLEALAKHLDITLDAETAEENVGKVMRELGVKIVMKVLPLCRRLAEEANNTEIQTILLAASKDNALLDSAIKTTVARFMRLLVM